MVRFRSILSHKKIGNEPNQTYSKQRNLEIENIRESIMVGACSENSFIEFKAFFFWLILIPILHDEVSWTMKHKAKDSNLLKDSSEHQNMDFALSYLAEKQIINTL